LKAINLNNKSSNSNLTKSDSKANSQRTSRPIQTRNLVNNPSKSSRNKVRTPPRTSKVPPIRNNRVNSLEAAKTKPAKNPKISLVAKGSNHPAKTALLASSRRVMQPRPKPPSQQSNRNHLQKTADRRVQRAPRNKLPPAGRIKRDNQHRERHLQLASSLVSPDLPPSKASNNKSPVSKAQSNSRASLKRSLMNNPKNRASKSRDNQARNSHPLPPSLAIPMPRNPAPNLDRRTRSQGNKNQQASSRPSLGINAR